jgi:C1A family cysteine protease
MSPDRPHSSELAAVRAALSDLGQPWQAAETRMSRLSPEWRAARLGVPAPTDQDLADRRGQPEAMAVAALAAHGQAVTAANAPQASLPASFDLRNVGGNNYVTAIRDQGGCGSCVAFGCVGAMESTAAYTHGSPGMALDLSEQHLFFVHAKARGYTCATGSWPDDLLSDCATKGITFEDYFPYHDNGSGTLNADWPNRLAKAVGLVNLTGDPAAIKQHIYSYGGVAACFVVYNDFFHYRSGVYKHTTEDVAGGHCITLIGWDDAAGCWIGKNQWGTGWGDGGFFRIAYGDSFIEDYPGDRPTVFGCTGVNLRAWLPAQRVLRLFATANDANGWAYLQNFGWAHLAGGPHTTTNKLDELTHARASGHAVAPFLDGSELSSVLVYD